MKPKKSIRCKQVNKWPKSLSAEAKLKNLQYIHSVYSLKEIQTDNWKKQIET